MRRAAGYELVRRPDPRAARYVESLAGVEQLLEEEVAAA